MINKKIVMILEDDIDLAEGIELSLQSDELNFVICETIAEARKALEHYSFDLLIFDINLPELCAPAKLGAELPPLGQKAALGPAERPAGRQTAGVFDFCVFPAGDLLHPSFLQLPKHTKRTPAYLIRAGVFFKVY